VRKVKQLCTEKGTENFVEFRQNCTGTPTSLMGDSISFYHHEEAIEPLHICIKRSVGSALSLAGQLRGTMNWAQQIRRISRFEKEKEGLK